MINLGDILKLRPRERWFSASSRDAECGWFGPYKTFEAAVMEQACECYGAPIFVAHGRKLTQSEVKANCAEHDWEVDSKNAVEVRMPTRAKP